MNEIYITLGVLYTVSFLFTLLMLPFQNNKLIIGTLSSSFLLLSILLILSFTQISSKLQEIITILFFISIFLTSLAINIRLTKLLSTKRLKFNNAKLNSLKLFYEIFNYILLVSFLTVLIFYFLGIGKNSITTSIQVLVLISLASTIIIESILKQLNEISLLRYLEDMFILVPISINIISTISTSNLLTSSAPILIIPFSILAISSISPYWNKPEENQKLLAILLQLIIFILPIIIITSYVVYTSLTLNLKDSTLTIPFIGIVLILLSTFLLTKLTYTSLKVSIEKTIKKLIEIIIPKVSEEKLPYINMDGLLEYLHKSLNTFLGKNAIEVYSFDNLERSLSLILVIDGGKGIITEAKKLRLSYKDLNIISSKRSTFFTESNQENIELIKKLNSDLLIPITYKNELKFIISIIIDNKFTNNLITNIYFSEVFHWLTLMSDSILSRNLSRIVNYNAIIFIEDQEIKQSLTASLLINNFDVFAVNNYQEAIELIEKIPIDLVITDVKVREKEGITLIKSIKNDPTRSNIVTILCYYTQEEVNSKEFLESYADHQVILKDDIIYLNNLVSYMTHTTSNKKRLESIYKNINLITSYSGILLNKIINYKSTLLEDIESEIIQKVFSQVNSYNTPSFIIIGAINSTVINAKIFSTLASNNVFFVDRIMIPLDFYSRKRFGKNKVISTDFIKEELSPSEFSNTLAKEITAIVKTVYNFIAVSIENMAIIALNYPERISSWDIDLLKSVLINYLLIKTAYEEIREVDSAFIYMMQSLARASEEMDEETGQHIYRVGEYSRIISNYLGLNEEFSESIYYASQMHDIGKLKIPREILRKPGKLTPEEFEIMKEHTIAGALILGDHPKLTMAREIALSHHEKWDGSGYPYGLQKESIPISARITMLADVYDALRSPRTYKPELPHDRVYEIITKGDGRTTPSHFDPDILTAFKEINEKFNEIYEKYRDIH